MLQPKTRPATHADIEAFPPHVVGEIVFGTLHTHPRPAPSHSISAGQLQSELNFPFGRGRGCPGGWIFMVEPELHLGPNVVVPDIAGWKRERLSPYPTTAWIETALDWRCEVLSPSTQKLDRTDKLAVYAAFGFGHCWSVDPDAKTLEGFALVAGKRQIAATSKDSDPVCAPPCEAHTFPLDVLWMTEAPRT